MSRALERIGLFVDRTYFETQSCYVELARGFLNKGHEVDVFTIMDADNSPPMKLNQKMRVFNFPRSKIDNLAFWKRYLVSERLHYGVVIGTAVLGASFAASVARISGAKLVYLADEVVNPAAGFPAGGGPAHERMVARDWNAARKSDRIISLSEARHRYLCEVAGIGPDHPYSVIPNSQPGEAVRLKSSFIREFLGIQNDLPIVLFIGTMQWNLARRVWDRLSGVEGLPFNVVFHGRSLHSLEYRKHDTIYVSSIPVPYALLNFFVSSADVGLVLYDKEIEQERRNAETGGKIATYLRNKLPLVYGNCESLAYLGEDGLGRFWDGQEDVIEVIARVVGERAGFGNAIDAFYAAHLDYQRPFDQFYEELRGNEGRRGESPYPAPGTC